IDGPALALEIPGIRNIQHSPFVHGDAVERARSGGEYGLGREDNRLALAIDTPDALPVSDIQFVLPKHHALGIVEAYRKGHSFARLVHDDDSSIALLASFADVADIDAPVKTDGNRRGADKPAGHWFRRCVAAQSEHTGKDHHP